MRVWPASLPRLLLLLVPLNEEQKTKITNKTRDGTKFHRIRKTREGWKSSFIFEKKMFVFAGWFRFVCVCSRWKTWRLPRAECIRNQIGKCSYFYEVRFFFCSGGGGGDNFLRKWKMKWQWTWSTGFLRAIKWLDRCNRKCVSHLQLQYD